MDDEADDTEAGRENNYLNWQQPKTKQRKRNLSESPKIYKNKRKTLTCEDIPSTSNKFAALQNCDDNDDDGDIGKEPTTPKPPPIYIPDVIDFDFIRNQQKISTIEPSYSPTRSLLTNTPPLQHYTLGVNLQSSHNFGYCTLRSGIQTSSVEGTISGNEGPQVYTTAITQRTLPRHKNHNIWPNYNTVITSIQQMQPPTRIYQNALPISSNSRQMQPESLDNVVFTANSSSIKNKSYDFFQENIQVHRARENAGVEVKDKYLSKPECLSDEEASVQTPLMLKRESSV